MRIKKDEKGHYPAYAWPGGYPIVYLARDGAILCAECASKEKQKVLGDVHWEGPAYACHECSEEIESAYGIPDET